MFVKQEIDLQNFDSWKHTRTHRDRKWRLRYDRLHTVRFSIALDTERSVHMESIFYNGARPVYRSVSGHFSRIQRSVYVDGRPRYDPGTYDSYCARSRNERSLHDLPLLDPARSLIRRYSDLLIANNAPHTGVSAVLAAAHRYDYVSIDAEVDVSRRKRTVRGAPGGKRNA